jgi:TRAP-type mannitol/chloroaromatic compound transport system permease small subunit
VLYGMGSGKTKAWIDLAGLIFFLLPVMTVMIYFSWPLFQKMYLSGEMSSNAGGLIRWPAMLMLPLGFALLLVQGVSEIIKRVAWLAHKYDADFHYERPLQ